MGIPTLSWPDRRLFGEASLLPGSYLVATVVTALAVAIAVSFALLYRNFHRLEDDGAQINLAGRQRMLAEQVGALSLEWVHAGGKSGSASIDAQLSGTLRQLEESRRQLLGESEALPASLRRLYFEEPNAANVRLELILDRARRLLDSGAAGQNPANPDFRFIQEHLPALVASLDRVTGGYQRLYEQNLQRGMTDDGLLRLLTLLLLAVLALLIFRWTNGSRSAPEGRGSSQGAPEGAERPSAGPGARGGPAPAQLAAKADRRIEQLAALLLLTDRASHAGRVPFAMQSAAYGIFRTLDARPVLIGELCDDGKRFLPQTTIGLPRELVPADPGAIADASLAGRALRSATAVRLCIDNEPGWLEDLPYLREQAVASGLAAVIRDAAGPRGLVLAFGGEADRFSDADLDFVQAIANLLGMQMDRDRLLADRGEPALSLVSN